MVLWWHIAGQCVSSAMAVLHAITGAKGLLFLQQVMKDLHWEVLLVQILVLLIALSSTVQ